MATSDEWLDKRYRNGDSYMRVVGYIDRPALILQDPLTGERNTVIIGCPNHQGMEEISDAEVLQILENSAMSKAPAS